MLLLGFMDGLHRGTWATLVSSNQKVRILVSYMGVLSKENVRLWEAGRLVITRTIGEVIMSYQRLRFAYDSTDC